MKPPRLAAGAALSLLLLNASGEQYYQTKTPYQPQQASASYEAPPQGYRAVYTQLLARHGSRGLSSMKTDLALYKLWQLAEKEKALTPLGAQLGDDLLQMMKANALLGYGVAGITKPGYGNETMQGVTEHKQLAERMIRRLPQLFNDAAAAQRRILLVTSGKDRAVDSGEYFAGSLVAQLPKLQALIVRPPSLAPRAETNHDSRPAGTDRFLLYFHKLSAKQDAVADSSDPLHATWQASQEYQAWARSDELRAREAAILAQPQVAVAARAVLERLFTPAFIVGLDQGRYSAANTGTWSYTSADKQFTNKLTGDGDTEIKSAIDAAQALYDLYAAAADMKGELKADFTRYMPAPQAAVFAATEDAIAFYTKGPGISENGGVNYRMAQALLDDFFGEVDAVAKGDLSHAAKLRFAHAEIVIPMAAILGLPGMSEPLPRAVTFSYANSNWRGEAVAPMAANIQWDIYVNDEGRTLVRMLYNEKETDFKRACDHAKLSPVSHFYDYARLRACYLPK
ncbi:histidine-type phosphatase [Rugamonas sp. FT82W]|uniref:Multiple inositol polyphosphate phosphatase 1 n=1 Tax=Duganella vulcania TaxID=2692166 RepID=A0A845FVE6_9BURK|nr:histidine-type phosphatase [Duganella vulcania]MYM86453.1 histidine-type phosphatase [Duganella vulcania]